MLKIDTRYIAAVGAATSAEDLYPLVQEAIRLEHATIPPYLCGYFTLKPGSNEVASEIIRSVVIEEMLHMTIAANLLIALGGSPEINRPGFVPGYPGALPFGIGDHLEIHLRKCSIPQVRDVFMAIEEPEHPIDIPTLRAMAEAAPQPVQFATIGAFYAFLAEKITELGDSIAWDVAKQAIARKWFPESELFPIDGPDAAVRAIGIIVDQGEGTSTDPFDAEGVPAHYYRFQEIVKGRKLIPAAGEPPYSFAGAPVSFDPGSVWDMDDDPKAARYREGSRSRRLADQFNYSYTMLLNALHRAFNGEPGEIDAAMGVMYELRLLAQQVLATPAEWADPGDTTRKQTGLSFEYQPLNR